ncbi:DNA gyrase subunit A [bacterium]|nr:DNA gyrase subunit A [bacterium]|tara:strand:- start:18482 stop:20950 length:2469 start_codon:yes stop_codon:yes gene_type:complete
MPKKKDEQPKEENTKASSNVIPMDIVPEMKESYLDYAMSVIVSRALPDVRDGLKPVHRRILFTMHEMGLTSSSKFRKSANVVGTVLAKYHPHGDSSVYDAMVKLAQDFSTRYPMVMPQGNFGSIDGDPPAAYRYTEAKMSKIAAEMLRDIEKETVEFRPNFDNTAKEPVVLPARTPNLLLNGTLGIAVGMATKMPPHNLGEVMDALMHVAENEKATTEDLMQFIKGPDFPTGGIVFNKKDIHHAYANGKGGVVVRGETDITETKSGQFQIVVSSIPYQVNRAELIIKIADLVRDKKIEGVKDIRDESTDDTRIVIDLKGGGHPQKVVNALYKHTDLETTYHYNMLALREGVPELLSLKDILDAFIIHRNEIVTRRTAYDLRKAEERAHILEGLKKALDNIDAVIKTIKSSKDTPTAHANLMKKFKLTDVQATAILDMRLQKLAGLERKKIEDELKDLKVLIKELKAILADKKKVLKIVIDEFKEIKEKYGDDRRTKVVAGGVKNISVEDLVPEVEQVVALTHGGYIKRTDPGEYRKQKRGGSGVIDLNTKDEDFVTTFLTASTHSDLLFFTDKGKAYQIKMYDLPEGKRATKGKSVMNYLQIEEGEVITSVLAMPKEVKGKELSLVMVTEGGMVKKVKAESFHDVRRSGIIAIKLGKGDSLLFSGFVEKGDTVSLITKKGQSIRFTESDVREMGRAAAGVRGITLKSGDKVVSASATKKGDNTNTLLVVGEKGFGKKTSLKEYKVQKRGGGGVKTAKVTSKTGDIIGAKIVTEDDKEILAISKHGQIIRMGLEDVPTLGRQTQGVRLMKLKASDSLASLTCL